eukprot:COSAG06_NODE_30113_length_544_cov_1.494382_1_plen_34_part_10
MVAHADAETEGNGKPMIGQDKDTMTMVRVWGQPS